jgi:hypothetical protein
MARKAPVQDGLSIVGKAWSEVKKINWHEVNRLCQQNFHIGLVGSAVEIEAMQAWLRSFPYLPAAGAGAGGDGHAPGVAQYLTVIAASEDGPDEKLVKSTTFCLAGREAANAVRRMKGEVYLFDDAIGRRLTTQILSNHPEVQFALAHNFAVFRPEMAQSVIQDTAFQNAAWALVTGLPNTVPGPHVVLTSPFEGISDFTILTLNEIKLLFELVGLSGRRVVPLYHGVEFAMVVGLGKLAETVAMQALGRLSGRAGILAKGAIAYAFTWMIGEAVFFYLTTGRRLGRPTFAARFREHFRRGRKVAEDMAPGLH